MANFRLANILITDPVDGAFTTDDELIVMWDNVAEGFSLTLNGSPFSTAGTLLGELDVNYSIIIGISSTENGYAVAGYSFCDGADLTWFRMVTTFPQYPFFEKVITVDSPVCDVGGGVVCDIMFSGAPTITHATDLTTGGSITALAVSSNGTVKYDLRGADYDSMTNTSGTFSGLPPGVWTLYAKDGNDCTAIINFKILFKPVDVEHYRFTWDAVPIGQGNTREERVRIYERGYVGDLVEVHAGGVSPFNLVKPKQGQLNDKLFPIHPTSATLTFISEVDYQFLPLFTEDNKRYRAVYEVDEGGGFVEDWQGFFNPNVYREDFIAAPYVNEFQIGDNVKTLEQEPFTDDEGNLLFGSMKLIKVIAHIMKKTGLELSIRSGINIFEAAHDTDPEDDPLDQTYIDVACYREGTEPFNCWDVLEKILRPFGARIYQCNNQWQIEEIDRAVDEYAYRLFDSNGDYVSNSTFDPIQDIKAPEETDRVALKDRDHSLEVVPAYGKITLTSQLNYLGSIVAGGFEKEDLLYPEPRPIDGLKPVYSSEELFRDWTYRHNGTTGGSFGRLTTPDDRSVGAFYFDADGWSGNLRDAYIESSVKPYQYGPGDELRFKFEYNSPAKPEYSFMVLRFMIKLGSDYLQQDLEWDSAEHIFRVYPSISSSFQKYELSVPVPDTTVLVDTTVQVRIYYYAQNFYDFGLPPPHDASGPGDGSDGVADLKAFPTTTINYDYRLDFRYHKTTGSVTNYSRAFAELRYSDAAEDVEAGIIRPNDFNGTTNPVIWWGVGSGILENRLIDRRTRGIDRQFCIDDVTLDTLINGQAPPEEKVISLPISKNVDENLEVDLYNFDLPTITNGKNMYNNYFRLSDGTPTALWARSGISESLPLAHILLKVLGGNHSAPTFRLTGSFLNEFTRIGINNYLRLTKPGSSLSLTNTEFTTDLTGWTQTGVGTTFTWTADNSGSAEVTLTGAVNSKKIYQTISHSGGYIQITGELLVEADNTNDREDILWVVFYRDSSIIHAEKLKTFTSITSDSAYTIDHTAFAPGQVTGIGFFFQHINGSGSCTYQVGEFTPDGRDIEEVYQITDYQMDSKNNSYFLELMQISKTYVSLAGIDIGGTNQAGTTTGRAHSSAYSSAYN